MYVSKELCDYGTCGIMSCIYPANVSATGKKYESFEVWDSLTGEPLEAFTTRRQAKKFAHRFTADPEGTIQKRRMLSGDRLAHCRTLSAVSLLSIWTEFDLTIADKRTKANPNHYKATDIFVNSAGNAIVLWYYPSDTALERNDLYIRGINAAKAINDRTFAFETYDGKIYTVSGLD